MTSKFIACFAPCARASISVPYEAHWMIGGSGGLDSESFCGASSVRFRFVPLDSTWAAVFSDFPLVEFRSLRREASGMIDRFRPTS